MQIVCNDSEHCINKAQTLLITVSLKKFLTVHTATLKLTEVQANCFHGDVIIQLDVQKRMQILM
jgi:hypothetical protein